MEFSSFVRRPFTIEAIQITEENISDMAEFIGTLRQKEDGTPYIQVDRKLVPSIPQVYPGFWMTKMDNNIRCYSNRTFMSQFVETSSVVEEAMSVINSKPVTNGTSS